MKEIMLKDGSLFYLRDFIDKNEAEILFEKLVRSLVWRQDEIKMFGKVYDVPRLQAWYGDMGLDYSYSGIKLSPEPWTEELNEIREKIAERTGISFNSVLANYYRHGQDSNGWHADNERELGDNPVIASVSLGQAREFQMKHRNKVDKYRILLEAGSLLMMQGRTQQHWLHQIAKTKKVIEPRVNLTFRQIIASYQ